MVEPGSRDPATQPVTPVAALAQTHGFLFADLRGYTSFTDTRGDHAAAELLERYRALVRDAVAAASGAEIRTEGDSFYIVFDSVSSAVRCGLAIIGAAARAGSDGEPIEVGLGLHAGEAVHTVGGFVGSPVNIAARLCAQAKAGELVVSDTVRALTRTYLDVEFQPLGDRRLKGVAEPVTVYRVVPGDGATGRTVHGRASGPHGIVVLGLGAIVALAAAALFVASRPVPPGLTGATSPPGASAATLATVHPAPTLGATSTVGAGASPQPFPNAVERALLSALNALPHSITDTCGQGPYAAVKAMYGEAVPIASVDCAPGYATGASQFVIRQFGPYRETGAPAGYGIQGSLDASVIGRIAAGIPNTRSDDILPGDCATEPRATGDWEDASGTVTGMIICYADPATNDAILWWTYTKPSILVMARNKRGDAAALYAFFMKYRDFIGP